jgi:hypothetical protein
VKQPTSSSEETKQQAFEGNHEADSSEVFQTLQEDILGKLEAADKAVDIVPETSEDNLREDLPKVDDVIGEAIAELPHQSS